MNRDSFIRFRVTAEEKELIQQKASASYRSLSRYVRDAAWDKPVVSMRELQAVAFELRRIGNNLNQLTMLAQQDRVRAFGLQDMRGEVARLWQSVNSFLQSLQ